MITMKKVIAVLLAMILAFSFSALAFAEDTTTAAPDYTCPICGHKCNNESEMNDCINSHRDAKGYLVCPTCGKEYLNIQNYLACENSHIVLAEYTCATCGAVFTDQEAYNDHLATHYNNVNHHWTEYVGLTLPQLLDQFMGYVQASGVEQLLIDIAYQLYEAIMSYIQGTGTTAEVAGATDKLDNAIASVNIDLPILTQIKEFINAIKQKIKNLYAGEAETVVEVTDAEAPVDTGSATAGIAAFAVIAAAAAAAYVCSKKKA
jgi:DNA-directed RNA polymerase subunit RPC12/RpoP